MQKIDINHSAEELARNWRDDGHFDVFPGTCAPETVDIGYRVQQRLLECLGTPQVGWKIAATSTGGQHHIGVDHPLIGRLLADRVYPAPATLKLRCNGMRVAEAEFCFRFGRALDPSKKTYSREAVFEYVDALFPAVEVPDSRFNDFVSAGAASLVADNACAREFVLGDEVMAEWRDIAFDRFPVSVYVNGALAVEGIGADVLGDPRDALTWLVNECIRRNMVIEKGHIVTTGVLGKPVPIQSGDHVCADFGVLGNVDVTFAKIPSSM